MKPCAGNLESPSVTHRVFPVLAVAQVQPLYCTAILSNDALQLSGSIMITGSVSNKQGGAVGQSKHDVCIIAVYITVIEWCVRLLPWLRYIIFVSTVDLLTSW